MTGACRRAFAWAFNDGTQCIQFLTHSNWYAYDIANDTLYENTVSGYSAGTASSATATAYGAGAYGAGPYGGSFGAVIGTTSQATTWTIDKWGEDINFCRRDSAIYQWDASGGFSTNLATAISGAPSSAIGIFVTEDRHLVAYGAHDGSAVDPLLVRWSDQEDNTTWTPTATNKAGDFRLERGTRCVGSVPMRGGEMIFTDNAAYSFYPVGGTLVFGRRLEGVNCGLIGPMACTSKDGIPFWMGYNQIFTFDGAVREIPCPIRSYIFDDINRNEPYKITASVNSIYNEIWFFYPSKNSDECDRHIILNLNDFSWSIGSVPRSAFIDRSVVTNTPVGVDYDGTDGCIFNHETGTNAAGVALSYAVEMADMDIGEGDGIMHVDRIIPDNDRITGDHNFHLEVMDQPNSTATTKGPWSFDSTTTKQSLRARGRAMRLRIYSDMDDADIRLGNWRARVRQHGARM